MSAFQLQKAYLRKCLIEHNQSLVSLDATQDFKTDFKLAVHHETPNERLHEITLSLDLEIKQEDKTVATINIQQAGIFIIENYKPEQLDELTKSYCPHLLFPYLREETAHLTRKAGFSTFELPLMDFNAIYQQQKQQSSSKTPVQSEAALEAVH